MQSHVQFWLLLFVELLSKAILRNGVLFRFEWNQVEPSDDVPSTKHQTPIHNNEMICSE